MRDQSWKYEEPISRDTHSATSLQGSGAGPSHSNSQGGLQISMFGQDHHLVSPSQMLGKDEDTATQDISGLSSRDLSQSASLQLSLENRLQARLAGRGSQEYALTWKHWDLESGLPICALRASVRRISDKGSSGWPTPQTADSWVPKNVTENPLRRGDPNGPLRTTSGTLAKDVMIAAGWPTPAAVDSGKLGNQPNYGQVGLSNHPGLRGLPQREPMEKSRKKPSGWPTPTTRDYKGGYQGGRIRNGKLSTDSLDITAQLTHGSHHYPLNVLMANTDASQLNPNFVRWLMGYPKEWFSSVPTATQLSRKSQKNS